MNEKNQEMALSSESGHIFDRVVSILEQARSHVARAVNSNMVWAYWLIGREIVLEVQGGEERAEYGKKLIEDLSVRLNEKYGKGFSTSNLWYFRQFYLAYEHRANILHPAGGELNAPEKVHPSGGELGDAAKRFSLGLELASTPIPHSIGAESLQGFSQQLSWSHYRALMRVKEDAARDFYERFEIERERRLIEASYEQQQEENES